MEFVKNFTLPVSRFFISLISLHVFSPAQLFRAPLAFQELLAYQALTVVTAQKENEETGPKGEQGSKGEAGAQAFSNWKQCVWNGDDGRDFGLIKVAIL